MSKVGRNDLCWCGSGKKLKRCHITADRSNEFQKGHSPKTKSELLAWFRQDFGEAYCNRRHFPTEFAWSAAFSYAQVLSMNRKFEQAVEVLDDLRSATSQEFQSCLIAQELCYAHLRMRNLESALREADLALELGRRCGRTSAVPLMYRGEIRSLMRERNATIDLLNALSLTCETKDVVNGGRIANHLAGRQSARDFVDKKERDVWRRLAYQCFKQFSPTLLDMVDGGESAEPDDLIEAGDLTAEQSAFRDLMAWCRERSEVRFISLLDMDLFGHLWALHMRHVSTEFPGHSVQLPMTVALPPVEARKLASILQNELERAVQQPADSLIVAETYLAAGLGVACLVPPALETCQREKVMLDILPGNEPETTNFLWSSQEPWPWTFSIILATLGFYYSTGFMMARTARRRGASSETPLLDNYPRALLTRMAGYGELEAGATVSVTHLCFLHLRRLLNEQNLNLDRLRSIGYDLAEARDLADSGFLCLEKMDVEIWRDQSEVQTINGAIVKEYGDARPGGPRVSPEQMLPGILVDKYYRTAFLARRLDAPPSYYANGKPFPAEIAKCISTLPVVDVLRCPRFEVPVVEAHSLLQLQNICGMFANLQPSQPYFRGQSAQHRITRKPGVCQFLYGAETVVEPSLLGSATRRGLDYSVIHPLLQVMIQDKLYETAARSRDAGPGLFHEVHDHWQKLFIGSPTFPYAAFGPSRWESACMAFAQHYGVPTHGLDITSSIEVAAWFATNDFTRVTGGATYVRRKPEEWAADPQQYPVVYIVLPLIDSLMASIWDIPTLGDLGLSALRPERQKAAFFMGADAIHQNRLAEALVCAIRLAPGDWETGLTYKELFPLRQEDPAYDFMLSLKERFRRAPYRAFLDAIPEYV
jgi:hypothetical protein